MPETHALTQFETDDTECHYRFLKKIRWSTSTEKLCNNLRGKFIEEEAEIQTIQSHQTRGWKLGGIFCTYHRRQTKQWTANFSTNDSRKHNHSDHCTPKGETTSGPPQIAINQLINEPIH